MTVVRVSSLFLEAVFSLSPSHPLTLLLMPQYFSFQDPSMEVCVPAWGGGGGEGDKS